MYQFSGRPGGTYQHPQQADANVYAYGNAQFPQVQPDQAYSQPHNPPMQQQYYQALPQIAHPAAPQYTAFPAVHPSQQSVFNAYGPNLQQTQSRNGGYASNPSFTNQQPGAYASSPVAMMPQQAAQFGPQAITPNNPFPCALQRQAPPSRAKSFPNKPTDSCYNCGAPDHWAQDCLEARRAVPAGQLNRSNKRQKTHGGNVAINPQHTPQQPPDLQRGRTDPAPQTRSFSISSNSSNVQTSATGEQRPWVHNHNHNQTLRMSSASSNGVAGNTWTHQKLHQHAITPQSAGSNFQNSWTQQPNHQAVNQYVTAHNNQPRPGQQQNVAQPSPSNAITSNARPWNSQQFGLDQGTLPTTNTHEQTAAMSNYPQAGGPSISQISHWSAQNLPTPAPSSIDSQIPSPATSNLNPIDQCAQQTPRYTESPKTRQDSASSAPKKNQDPRTQQAEMVAGLFHAAAQAPASKSNSPESPALMNESVEDIEDDVEELYGLDFPEFVHDGNTTTLNPPLVVAEPLSITHDCDVKDQPQATVGALSDPSQSKYIRDVREEDFLKNVQESSEWDVLKNDPVFAKIKANTATVTFEELIERRRQVVRKFTEVEEDDEGDDHQYQETEEERLAEEQEERLAALGVTGTAKPIKASPAEVPFAGTPSPAETLVARRVSGDPGWKHYQNGRAVKHTSVSPNTDGSNQHPQRKRVYSEDSDEPTDIPRRQESVEPKPRKPRLKQPKVAAAYGRRW